ncbi:hypothetical protein PFLCHA0_c54490 [Pseudomonas protegens CHA0]|uniref:Uncharacterized protein n=1 Tax=Pseudomonas protegens (strain DSM 19095 / LMG 27888 / CFBP 6595 / CHA0) TaxID=1124983 RepID=A0A2C9EU37_PSEPH|nr:hypothetical protein PFLCHA0_c54490 [Pseudomonas protegens CHA0]
MLLDAWSAEEAVHWQAGASRQPVLRAGIKKPRMTGALS